MGLPLGMVAREVRNWRPMLVAAIEKREGAAVAAETLDRVAARARAIAEATEDPGMLAPHMRAFTVGGLLYVAVHLELRERGYDAARSWAVCEEATRSRFASMSGLERRLASDGLFSWAIKALSRWLAKKSETAPVGGWRFGYVEGRPGELDYGVDYHRCAIRELAIANGAGDFAPYVCLADVAGSEIFGWGLVRTETLAQGGTRCDFRFKRGGPTDVKVRLPVV